MIKPRIVFLGPLPPPHMGPSVATEIILNSKLGKEFELIHLDTSDHRDICHLSAIDFKNFYLALKQYFILIYLIITRWPAIIYIPNCQTTIGYIRDAGFIMIAKLFRRKVICHLRGGNFRNWYNSTSFVIRQFINVIHSFIDGQIVLGESLKHLFDRIISKERISVVPNGKNFDSVFKRKIQAEKLRVFYLSNLIKSKGILEVLRAIPVVYNANPNIEFIFAGSWYDNTTKKSVESFIKEHPYLPITYYGAANERAKYDLFGSSDIFAFPTYYTEEGHPWVIIEAMAFGLPIISTDQGAIKESVVNGINGFIVEKQNSSAIAEKIITLINNPELRIKMGKESRRLYKDKFTEEKMVENLSRVFNAVLGR